MKTLGLSRKIRSSDHWRSAEPMPLPRQSGRAQDLHVTTQQAAQVSITRPATPCSSRMTCASRAGSVNAVIAAARVSPSVIHGSEPSRRSAQTAASVSRFNGEMFIDSTRIFARHRRPSPRPPDGA